LFSTGTNARKFTEVVKRYREERNAEVSSHDGEKGGSSAVVTEAVETKIKE
jgi:hypothetical protein